MAKLYIITGPAGVGKSTVTKALAEKIGKCAIIEGDEIYHQVIGGEKPWLEGNHLDIMWKNVTSLTKNYLDAKIDTIFNYIVYKDDLDFVLKALAKYEVHFVVLTANKNVVAARDESRGEEFQVGRVETHLKEFSEQGYDDKFFMNTENKSVESEVDEILSGKFMIQSAVDKSHCSGLQKLYFDMIATGEKIYELRVHDEKRQGINAGEDYVFGLEPERNKLIRKTIKQKHLFSSFAEAADKLDPKKVGFATREEMKLVYGTIYSKEEQEKYGVVAFELED